LQSQRETALYTPSTDSWTALAPLPEVRSSFDAAVLGDHVYVFGGWNLDGQADSGQWLETAWSLDLSDSDAVWKPLAKQPFRRRVISVAAHNGKLFVIGGVTPEGPTTDVDLYDPALDCWTQAEPLPGVGMSEFGSSSFATGGTLYVSTLDGFVHRWSNSANDWETIAKCDPARFFHRMVPIGGSRLLVIGGSRLLVIGGANMELGTFKQIEAILLPQAN